MRRCLTELLLPSYALCVLTQMRCGMRILSWARNGKTAEVPWWGILLIALGSAVVGGLIVYVAVGVYIAKSFNW